MNRYMINLDLSKETRNEMMKFNRNEDINEFYVKLTNHGKTICDNEYKVIMYGISEQGEFIEVHSKCDESRNAYYFDLQAENVKNGEYVAQICVTCSLTVDRRIVRSLFEFTMNGTEN